MKTVHMVIGVLLIILISVGAYAYLTQEKSSGGVGSVSPQVATPQTSALEQDFIEVPAITYLTSSDSVPSLRYTYSISYPAIALTGHQNQARAANSVIKTFVLDLLESFKKNLEPDGSLPSADNQTSDFALQSRPSLLSPTIISFRFDTAEYIAGGAHANNQTHVLNYDIEQSTIYSTEDLFASTTLALPFLSAYSRKILRERFSDISPKDFETTVLPGTAPTKENFRSVAIAKKGIIVIFDPYQVAPYARGTQEVVIPINDVHELLSPRVQVAIQLSEANLLEATELAPVDQRVPVMPSTLMEQ